MKDITKDRFCAVLAGTAFFATEGERLVNRPVATVTVVPADPAKDMQPGRYPRERYFRVVGEMVVGTVDEIVEHFRQGLVRSYEFLACKDVGDDAVIPSLGTPDFKPQHDANERYYGLRPDSFGRDKLGRPLAGGGTVAQLIDLANPCIYHDRESRRASMDEHAPQQEPLRRLAIHEVLAVYHQRVTSTGQQLGDMLEPGSFSALRVVDNVLADLQAYRADLAVVKTNRDRQYAERKATEHTVPAVKGCSRCGGDHEDVTFMKLKQPHETGGEVFTHWAWCPDNHEPIMMLFEDDEDDVADAVAAATP